MLGLYAPCSSRTIGTASTSSTAVRVHPLPSRRTPLVPRHSAILPKDACLERGRLCIALASSPDTEEARSPLDAPQEWEAPQPSKRPDIFPEFEKMDRVFLPKPLPGDPEMPDEEAEEAAKRTEPGDPDPEQKPGEPPEPREVPGEPGKEPEKPGTDIPNAPE